MHGFTTPLRVNPSTLPGFPPRVDVSAFVSVLFRPIEMVVQELITLPAVNSVRTVKKLNLGPVSNTKLIVMSSDF